MTFHLRSFLKVFLSKKIVVIIPVIIIIAALGVFAYNKIYKPSAKALRIKIPDFNIGDFKETETENVVFSNDVKTLIQNVGKLFELPIDEEPSVATITDISKLKDQPFFAQGMNGDKVLIYERKKKAIIYRPSINKIIEAGSVEISTGLETSEDSSGSDSASLQNPPVSTQRKVLIEEK